MSDIPDINFDDPAFLGRVNLTLDGTVWADLYGDKPDPFIGTGAILNLTEFYEALGYDPRDDVTKLVDETIEDYDGTTLSRWRDRQYLGLNQLKYKLEGMRNIWHYIETIWIDKSGGDLLDVFIIHFDSNFTAKFHPRR